MKCLWYLNLKVNLSLPPPPPLSHKFTCWPPPQGCEFTLCPPPSRFTAPLLIIIAQSLTKFLWHQLSMFRSFVLFIVDHYYFSGCDVFPKFLRYFLIVTCNLALSISLLLLFFFLLVISYFPYFKFVTFETRVILCNTLKKEGHVFWYFYFVTVVLAKITTSDTICSLRAQRYFRLSLVPPKITEPVTAGNTSAFAF